jgi:hypothetical protein
MQRSLVFAVTCIICVIGSTPGFARAGAGPGIGRGMGPGIERGSGLGIGRGAGLRLMRPRHNPIPAPLPEPAQPPVINGPLSPSGLPPMGNGL